MRTNCDIGQFLLCEIFGQQSWFLQPFFQALVFDEVGPRCRRSRFGLEEHRNDGRRKIDKLNPVGKDSLEFDIRNFSRGGVSG